MVQFTDLPADVIDHKYPRLPARKFQSLAAAIQVSKAYAYAVFKSHRREILTSVALNAAGPALPHALRVAVWQTRPCEPVDLNYDEPMQATTTSLAALYYECRRHFEENAVVVRRLEDIFSQMYADVIASHSMFSNAYIRSPRYKDQRSSTSMLNGVESLRFGTALYRLWLFCFSVQQMPDDIEDPEEEFGNWDANWDAITMRLGEYELQDLLDVIATSRFLQELLRRIMRASFHEHLHPDRGRYL